METIDLAEIERRVERGAALLDEKLPGWWEQIDLATLNICICDRCILGQLFGMFGFGLSQMFAGDNEEKCKAGRLHAYLGDAANGMNQSELTPIWKSLILSRRNPVTLPPLTPPQRLWRLGKHN